MTSQQPNAGNSPATPQQSAQIALEEWCVGTGGQRATAGDWMKGADGFMSHSFAAPYLEQVLKLYRKAKTAPTNFGAMWGLMENERAVLQVAAESLVHVISHSMDGRKRNSIAVEVGKRAEFVLWLSIFMINDDGIFQRTKIADIAPHLRRRIFEYLELKIN